MVSKQIGITTPVAIPTHPGDYTDITHAHKFLYEKTIQLYLEFKEHMRNSVKYFTCALEMDLLMGLKNSWGQIVEFTPIQIYDHAYDIFLVTRDISKEIASTYDKLKVEFE